LLFPKLEKLELEGNEKSAAKTLPKELFSSVQFLFMRWVP